MEQQNSLNKLSEPIFSRKKSLLTIGQYAVRQGVSAGVVQECARLGVVQVRKHKNKTFIVDLPLDTYKITKQQDYPSSEGVNTEFCANKISNLVSKIFQSDNQIGLLPAETERTEGKKNSGRKIIETNPVPAEPSFPQHWHKGPDTIPDLQLFAEEKNNVLRAGKEIEPDISRFRVSFLRSSIESIKAVSVWKLSFVLAASALIISICAYAWISIDRKMQQQKLQQAYESIGKLITKYEDVRQKARLYEFDMMNWRSEAEQSKKALIDSETKLQDVKEKLYETRKDFQAMQQYNAETLKELNEQISRIRSNIP
jgi:membrane protein implicated in regulation of membrane protease activity